MRHSTRHDIVREETDHKIFQAIVEITASRGIGAVSIEEVARRSGVAKTTIYRRYRNTDDLLNRVELTIDRPAELADLEPTRTNLRLLLENVARQFTGEIGITALGVALTSHSEYFERIVDRVIKPVQAHFNDFFVRGEQDGTFKRNMDISFLFSTIIGSMVASQALHKGDEQTWAKTMADMLWTYLAA